MHFAITKVRFAHFTFNALTRSPVPTKAHLLVPPSGCESTCTPLQRNLSLSQKGWRGMGVVGREVVREGMAGEGGCDKTTTIASVEVCVNQNSLTHKNFGRITLVILRSTLPPCTTTIHQWQQWQKIQNQYSLLRLSSIMFCNNLLLFSVEYSWVWRMGQRQ